VLAKTHVESAWLQLFKLNYDQLLPRFTFKCNLRPQTMAELAKRVQSLMAVAGPSLAAAMYGL